MTRTTSLATPSDSLAEREPAPSPAGPVVGALAVSMPPAAPGSRLAQTVRFGLRPVESALDSQARFGDVWRISLMSRSGNFVLTSHPEHARSLFTADAADAPSLTGESPLRPILGSTSVLTSVGETHMRQRRMLLPAFHGEAVQQYEEMISLAAERELDRWTSGRRFPLAPRMQAITLDVIMAGIFGIEGPPARGTAERRLRDVLRRMMAVSTTPPWQLVELHNIGREHPRGVMRWVVSLVDREVYALIRERRAAGGSGRGDVMSLLLEARDEDGRPLTDEELRDQLLTLVIAGHETTANSLAWTFDLLLRNPDAYERLRGLVRSGDEGAGDYVDAVVQEGMRLRPVVPIVVRGVRRPWRLGEYVVPAGTAVGVSIIAMHHREDVYPDPFAFRPERFAGRKPGTYTWIPFGGGIRRCLGATLAMAEQRIVLEAIARRVDLAPTSGRPERPVQRNVTTIPRRGTRVVVAALAH